MTVTATLQKTPPAKANRIAGTLTTINPNGYGFIRADGDYWVHIKDFPERKAWVVGQKVWFEPSRAKGRKAPRALNVTLRED